MPVSTSEPAAVAPNTHVHVRLHFGPRSQAPPPSPSADVTQAADPPVASRKRKRLHCRALRRSTAPYTMATTPPASGDHDGGTANTGAEKGAYDTECIARLQGLQRTMLVNHERTTASFKAILDTLTGIHEEQSRVIARLLAETPP